MARIRTTKKLAQRIDLNYFKRPTAEKRAKLLLSVFVPLLALGWLGFLVVSKDSRVYSSGHLSEAHAVLEKDCAACHVKEAGGFSSKASDAGCLACHDGPAHHQSVRAALECSECHSEHRGRVSLAAVNDKTCARCHSDLNAAGGNSGYGNSIQSLHDGHPQFAVLREKRSDPSGIKLNHAIHMKAIRRGPTGPMVQLECGDCHRPAAAKVSWKYSDAAYTSASPTYARDQEEAPRKPGEVLQPPKTASGREYMAPVKFATACASCHLLTFDKRFDRGVPHDKPEVVHEFLIKTFQGYIAAHPAELHETLDPDRTLTENRPSEVMQILTPPEWVAEHTAVAEELLWKKTCAQCHAVSGAATQEASIGRWSPLLAGKTAAIRAASYRGHDISASPLPKIAPAMTISRYMPHAKFDHDAHGGFTCVSCHEKALKSTESSDVLLPGIANCQSCHASGPGYAEARCSECHTYHDWAARKEMTPGYTPHNVSDGQQ